MNNLVLAFLVMVALEIGSDIAIMLLLGGWSILMLPFIVMTQFGFDVFLLIFLLIFIGVASHSNKTKVVQ